MAAFIDPSSFKCDCGHQMDFFESTIGEMEKMSYKNRQEIGEGGDPHTVEFRKGKAVAVICPQLGRCAIE